MARIIHYILLTFDRHGFSVSLLLYVHIFHVRMTSIDEKNKKQPE